MPINNKIIIGISPGTRSTGLALMHDQELIDWKMVALYETWSERKLRKIMRSLERMIDRHQVTDIAVKMNRTSHKSLGINQVLLEIISLAERRQIKLHTYTIDELKQHSLPEMKGSKRTLAEHLLVRYAELSPQYKKELLSQNPYYIKLFEAIACCLKALKE